MAATEATVQRAAYEASCVDAYQALQATRKALAARPGAAHLLEAEGNLLRYLWDARRELGYTPRGVGLI